MPKETLEPILAQISCHLSLTPREGCIDDPFSVWLKNSGASICEKITDEDEAVYQRWVRTRPKGQQIKLATEHKYHPHLLICQYAGDYLDNCKKLTDSLTSKNLADWDNWLSNPKNQEFVASCAVSDFSDIGDVEQKKLLAEKILKFFITTQGSEAFLRQWLKQPGNPGNIDLVKQLDIVTLLGDKEYTPAMKHNLGVLVNEIVATFDADESESASALALGEWMSKFENEQLVVFDEQHPELVFDVQLVFNERAVIFQKIQNKQEVFANVLAIKPQYLPLLKKNSMPQEFLPIVIATEELQKIGGAPLGNIKDFLITPNGKIQSNIGIRFKLLDEKYPVFKEKQHEASRVESLIKFCLDPSLTKVISDHDLDVLLAELEKPSALLLNKKSKKLEEKNLREAFKKLIRNQNHPELAARLIKSHLAKLCSNQYSRNGRFVFVLQQAISREGENVKILAKEAAKNLLQQGRIDEIQNVLVALEEKIHYKHAFRENFETAVRETLFLSHDQLLINKRQPGYNMVPKVEHAIKFVNTVSGKTSDVDKQSFMMSALLTQIGTDEEYIGKLIDSYLADLEKRQREEFLIALIGGLNPLNVARVLEHIEKWQPQLLLPNLIKIWQCIKASVECDRIDFLKESSIQLIEDFFLMKWSQWSQKSLTLSNEMIKALHNIRALFEAFPGGFRAACEIWRRDHRFPVVGGNILAREEFLSQLQNLTLSTVKEGFQGANQPAEKNEVTFSDPENVQKNNNSKAPTTIAGANTRQENGDNFPPVVIQENNHPIMVMSVDSLCAETLSISDVKSKLEHVKNEFDPLANQDENALTNLCEELCRALNMGGSFTTEAFRLFVEDVAFFQKLQLVDNGQRRNIIVRRKILQALFMTHPSAFLLAFSTKPEHLDQWRFVVKYLELEDWVKQESGPSKIKRERTEKERKKKGNEVQLPVTENKSIGWLTDNDFDNVSLALSIQNQCDWIRNHYHDQMFELNNPKPELRKARYNYIPSNFFKRLFSKAKKDASSGYGAIKVDSAVGVVQQQAQIPSAYTSDQKLAINIINLQEDLLQLTFSSDDGSSNINQSLVEHNFNTALKALERKGLFRSFGMQKLNKWIDSGKGEDSEIAQLRGHLKDLVDAVILLKKVNSAFLDEKKIDRVDHILLSLNKHLEKSLYQDTVNQKFLRPLYTSFEAGAADNRMVGEQENKKKFGDCLDRNTNPMWTKHSTESTSSAPVVASLVSQRQTEGIHHQLPSAPVPEDHNNKRLLFMS